MKLMTIVALVYDFLLRITIGMDGLNNFSDNRIIEQESGIEMLRYRFTDLERPSLIASYIFSFKIRDDSCYKV